MNKKKLPSYQLKNEIVDMMDVMEKKGAFKIWELPMKMKWPKDMKTFDKSERAGYFYIIGSPTVVYWPFGQTTDPKNRGSGYQSEKWAPKDAEFLACFAVANRRKFEDVFREILIENDLRFKWQLTEGSGYQKYWGGGYRDIDHMHQVKPEKLKELLEEALDRCPQRSVIEDIKIPDYELAQLRCRKPSSDVWFELISVSSGLSTKSRDDEAKIISGRHFIELKEMCERARKVGLICDPDDLKTWFELASLEIEIDNREEHIKRLSNLPEVRHYKKEIAECENKIRSLEGTRSFFKIANNNRWDKIYMLHQHMKFYRERLKGLLKYPEKKWSSPIPAIKSKLEKYDPHTPKK